MTRILVDQGTFAVTGPGGDIDGGRGATPAGLFVRDARHLSRWQLTADGQHPHLLTADDRQAVLALPGTRDEPSPYSLVRRQVVTRGALIERIVVVNNTTRARTVALRLTVDADFADQLELRSDRRTYTKDGAVRTVADRSDGVVFHYRRSPDWDASTAVIADPPPGEVAELPDGGRTLTWRVRLPAHGRSELGLAVRAFTGGGEQPADVSGAAGIVDPDVLRTQQECSATEFIGDTVVPESTENTDLARAVHTGLADLAGLRVTATGLDGEELRVPGAGTPWFLTLFGRDSLLTSLFCLPYRPELAAATLAALGAAQGRADDPSRLEQPGRIPHELRHGELAHFRQVPYGRYYGSVDATPLFLVLLQAYTERTRDITLARRLEPHARAAVAWMFRDGGLGERGWLVYTSDEQAGGLANQNWKDSAGAICFADDTQATGAVAVAEAQGYAYDALLRTARLAASVWRDPGWAHTLEDAAADLKRRFPQEFWLSEADFPAMALDGAGRRADALGSDAGHLLWSGILDQHRAERVARRLLEPDFFSGWGIRTLAADQAAYHPLSYHSGGIWPHDNAIIALGMARHGLSAEARTVADALITAARHHNWRLPEVISGYDRDLHPAPVPYPHACSPQAWAAATPLALLTATRPVPRSPGTDHAPG